MKNLMEENREKLRLALLATLNKAMAQTDFMTYLNEVLGGDFVDLGLDEFNEPEEGQAPVAVASVCVDADGTPIFKLTGAVGEDGKELAAYLAGNLLTFRDPETL